MARRKTIKCAIQFYLNVNDGSITKYNRFTYFYSHFLFGLKFSTLVTGQTVKGPSDDLQTYCNKILETSKIKTNLNNVHL